MATIRILLVLLMALSAAPAAAQEVRVKSFAVPDGAHPHDVAPAPDGAVWYTAQHQGALGRLDPKTGETRQVPLGDGSRPHGVVVGPDRLAWVTDGGLNAIVSVHPESLEVTRYPLPEDTGYTNLNTPTFDGDGTLWFTGQSGIYGSLDPASGEMRVFKAPRGYGPYGIHHTPDGTVWFSSLAGSYLARVDSATGELQVADPPTADAGCRRVWSDSKGALWVSDFGADAVLRFDPETETFQAFPSDRSRPDVRQMLGRKGEVWAAESGTDRLTVYRFD